jgi:DNA ligase-1
VNKPKLYKGGNLKGAWIITRKIDGVRALYTNNAWMSRNGKPLYNLDHISTDLTDIEVFCGSWEKTISKVRTFDENYVLQEEAFSLDPLDERLILGTLVDPTEHDIDKLLESAVSRGDEGLVLRQGNKWLKVKKVETYDIAVTGIVEGKGKYVGMLGAIETEKGNVGTGLTDDQRVTMFTNDLIGTTIEVECMELTKDGMFRHPRFVRMRFDK